MDCQQRNKDGKRCILVMGHAGRHACECHSVIWWNGKDEICGETWVNYNVCRLPKGHDGPHDPLLVEKQE
jgi:hypothetical protein